MTVLRAVVLVAALAIALWREAARWRAEIVLREVTSAFRTLAQAPRGDGTSRALDDLTMRAQAIAPSLPGDPRPLILAASAQLVAAVPARALALYGDALATGERAEIDLNLARAHAMLGNVPAAEAALLRMAWVSPALLERLNAPTRERIGAELQRLIGSLHDGTLSAPPPLPPS
ncbi:MAG TPA: hypothetical protein VGR62_07640 [Candidatus Binatia bacterium]|jgi:hypothetical protein|nr:hypothetical protein [Candidatus Binatia bacterium]